MGEVDFEIKIFLFFFVAKLDQLIQVFSLWSLGNPGRTGSSPQTGLEAAVAKRNRPARAKIKVFLGNSLVFYAIAISLHSHF